MSYINGFRLLAVVPWHNVDHVFIPVCVKEKFHWILLVLSFSGRVILIYDSIRSSIHDIYILKEVKKYAKVLPMYLAMSEFYKSRASDIKLQPKYQNTLANEAFEMIHVNGIPQQHEESL